MHSLYTDSQLHYYTLHCALLYIYIQRDNSITIPCIEHSLIYIYMYKTVHLYVCMYVYICHLCPVKPLHKIRPNFQGLLGMCCRWFLARKINSTHLKGEGVGDFHVRRFVTMSGRTPGPNHKTKLYQTFRSCWVGAGMHFDLIKME